MWMMLTTKIVHIICEVPKIHLNNNETGVWIVVEVFFS